MSWDKKLKDIKNELHDLHTRLQLTDIPEDEFDALHKKEKAVSSVYAAMFFLKEAVKGTYEKDLTTIRIHRERRRGG